MNEIIDFELRCNQVRFYLGKNGKQWGDDWNYTPYEHNAGTVYSEFVVDKKDVTFGFDDFVAEPCEGHSSSPWTKEDMIKRKVPCLVVVKNAGDDWLMDFDKAVARDDSIKYYFGDAI
jgi:hypothetical protein